MAPLLNLALLALLGPVAVVESALSWTAASSSVGPHPRALSGVAAGELAAKGGVGDEYCA